jgi:hypothetical protein
MLVFMGNFSAAATPGCADADYVGLREGFTRLARLIDTYAAIKVGQVIEEEFVAESCAAMQ